MSSNQDRIYRERVQAKGLVSFRMVFKETDLWVSADKDLEQETRDLVINSRVELENYIKAHPDFATALSPLPMDPYAPALVREMLEVTNKVPVGPMASVAGAIAHYVGDGLSQRSSQVIVENGGDVFIKLKRPATVAIFAGNSPLSEKIGLQIPVRQMPLGVATSSGLIGHSLSMGRADAVCVLSPSTALADAAATFIGNAIKGRSDLQDVAEQARQMDDLLGGVAILNDHLATWGDVELVEL